MKLKGQYKGFIVGVLITLILTSSLGSMAASVGKNIEVIYNNIKLVVDGKPVAFGKDSAGKTIEPFIYNGTTYLPVRAVGDAVGKKVNWDGATQTVYLGERPGEVSYMTEVLTPYSNKNSTILRLNETDKLNIAGTEFKTGYIPNNYKGGELKFNLNSLYKSLNFSYGPSRYYEKEDGNFNIYLDDNLYKSITVNQNDPVKTMNIDLTGVNQLRFEFVYMSAKTNMAIGDPILQ